MEDFESFLDKGFGEVIGNIYDNGKFWVLMLCNIVFIVFYMYDGCFVIFEEVLDFYVVGGYGIVNEDLNI